MYIIYFIGTERKISLSLSTSLSLSLFVERNDEIKEREKERKRERERAVLGGNIAFLQSVCVLGYCLCPLNIASIVCRLWADKIFHLVVVIFSSFLCFLPRYLRKKSSKERRILLFLRNVSKLTINN